MSSRHGCRYWPVAGGKTTTAYEMYHMFVSAEHQAFERVDIFDSLLGKLLVCFEIRRHQLSNQVWHERLVVHASIKLSLV